MRLPTRNQLTGTVTEVTVKEAVEELGLAPGTPTTVLVKSTEVMLGVD